MTDPLTREERLAAIEREWRHANATRSTPTDSWLNGYQEDVRWLLDRLAETERERDGAREAAATSAAGHMHWLQRGEAAEARLASSTVLSREDTAKLREALLARRREDGEDFLVDDALALLDGRKEKG